MSTITIDKRFNGPPKSGHGGYVAGLAAELVGVPAEITLRAPPPLGIPLQIEHDTDGGVELRDGDTLVVAGRPHAMTLDVPAPPSLEDAQAARRRSPRLLPNPMFPTCFACGADRDEGDGQRIFVGKIDGRPLVASVWTPSDNMTNEDGMVGDRFLWAALDCPGYGAIEADRGAIPALLGRMAATLVAPLRAGEPAIISAWCLEREGRKHSAGTAVFAADGTLCCYARTLWVELARR